MVGKIFFICGTDTSVGKTHFSISLINFLKKNLGKTRNVSVAYCKPFQTGAQGDLHELDQDVLAKQKSERTDAQLILENTGLKREEVVASYQLKKPASPHLAARLDRVEIDFFRVFDQIAALASHNDIVLVEGSGGLYVPLCLEKKGENFLFFLDFLREFFDVNSKKVGKKYEISCLLVARGGLGTINHTLLSLNALKENKLPVFSVHLNQFFSSEDEVINKDNKETIDFLAKRWGSLAFYYDYAGKNERKKNEDSFLGREFEIFLKNHLLQ